MVLYWTTYYNQVDFTFGLGRDPFIQAGCPVNNCWATNDRSWLNRSDAVLFHAGNYQEDDLPEERLQHQRFIFLLYETLPGAAHLPFFSATRDYFNWTMSHRRDADIYVGKPYGALRRIRHVAKQLPATLSPGEKLEQSESLMTRTYPRLTNRTKLVSWFNSHCPTHSQREDYVKELAKFVEVGLKILLLNLKHSTHKVCGRIAFIDSNLIDMT